MKILAIDSSSKPASAAVVDEGKLLSEIYINNGLTHSKTLMSAIKNALDFAAISIEEIDLIAVVTGPGSFTGVRIGVSCAKGLAFSRNIPCVSVSTLEALAYNLACAEGYVCSVMDARCSQVYTALFHCGKNGVERISEDSAISIDQLKEQLSLIKKENIYLVGDGAQMLYEMIQSDNIILANENIRLQKSSSAAWAGSKNKKDFIAPDALVPVYLRLPQAQRELKNKTKGE